MDISRTFLVTSSAAAVAGARTGQSEKRAPRAGAAATCFTSSRPARDGDKTPHDTFLKWICDVLDILKMHNIGWALWEFRGSFGVLDSGREDVAYETWHGHKLDRKLLTLLQYT